ncbi:MAG: CoA transferase, partial [Rhodococcus sp. (in: high G+C Gram-positive bacteria)]
SNAYPCNDGHSIIIAGNGDAIFQRYMETIDRPDLGADPELASNAGRWKRRDELDAAISAWTGLHSRDEALKILDAAGVPSGPIYTAADVVADEQYNARNMIQNFSVDTGGAEPTDVGFVGIVPVIGEKSIPIRSVGPDLGEHTAEVLRDLLGRTDEEMGA